MDYGSTSKIFVDTVLLIYWMRHDAIGYSYIVYNIIILLNHIDNKAVVRQMHRGSGLISYQCWHAMCWVKITPCKYSPWIERFPVPVFILAASNCRSLNTPIWIDKFIFCPIVYYFFNKCQVVVNENWIWTHYQNLI